LARIVLQWNEHPTEVVAGFHARKVAEILRNKYGHEVMMEKIPVAETNYGVVKNKSPRAAIVAALWGLKSALGRAEAASKTHSAFAFNFHSSKASAMADADTRPTKRFRVGIQPYLDFSDTELMIAHKKGDKHAVVEVPAFYEAMPENVRKRQIEQLTKIGKATGGGIGDQFMQLTELKPDYYLERTPLRHKQQQKYLDPAISEKLAKAINKMVRPSLVKQVFEGIKQVARRR